MQSPAQQMPEEQELATIIVDALDLDDVAADEIQPDAPLFSLDDGGLGLDSIDALEIALAINDRYGVEIKMDDDNLDEEALKAIFRDLRSLSTHIRAQTVAG